MGAINFFGTCHDCDCNDGSHRTLKKENSELHQTIQRLEDQLPETRQLIKDMAAMRSRASDPDPENFEIERVDSFGKFLVVLVNYPNCVNYEGRKTLVFEDVSLKELKKLNFLDPHFCEGDHITPVARFEPTDRGWDYAIKFAKI